MTGRGSGKRGRPLGFRLSEASKRAISMSKTGQQHRPETKDKISKSLIMYFRRKNPISEEITNRYCGAMDDDLCDWIQEVGDELDASMDIMTEKAIRNKCKMEITCGNNIEFFSHDMNPEIIYLFKEYCERNGLNPEDVLAEVF
jgi:hypothetical protein